MTVYNANEDYTQHTYFLTLTTKWVNERYVNDMIHNINIAFRKIQQTQLFRKFSLGFIKALDIAYNEESNMYGVHLHITLITFNNELIIHIMKLWTKLFNASELAQHFDIAESYTDIDKFSTYSIKNLYVAKKNLANKNIFLNSFRRISTSGIFAKYMKLCK